MGAYVQRAFRRDRPHLVPTWMPDSLRDELCDRHLTLSLGEVHDRQFSNPTRESEYRLLYPPEVARSCPPWPQEHWSPFADRRLHEFLLAIPPEQKFAPHPSSDNWYAASKRLVRQAMRGIVPESIRTRTSKTVFLSAWQREIELQWPLYERVFVPSVRSEIAVHGYVDQEGFWERLLELRSGTYRRDFVYVMRMIALETWLRTLKLPRSQRVTVPPIWGEQSRASTEEQIVVGRVSTI